MHIPKTVKVAGHILDVSLPPFIDGGDSEGEYESGLSTLFIAERTMSGEKAINQTAQVKDACFIHELLHAIDDVYNNAALPEEQIHRLSEGLYQVIIDNPLIFTKGG